MASLSEDGYVHPETSYVDENAPDGKPPVEDSTQPNGDPLVNIFANLEISDGILTELDACGNDQEKYKKFFKATDLFIIRMMIHNLDISPVERTPDFIAFRNMLKWFMYLLATNPQWHRYLCYYNRMMGVNTHSSSYWYLTYHPSYVPGLHFEDDLKKSPEQFNSELTDQFGIYKWIDEEMEKDDGIE